VDAERTGRLRRGLAAAAAAAAVLAAAAIALADGSGGKASGPEPSARAIGTGTLERRTLTEHLTATGTIGYAGESTVLARLAGTVTALPPVGDAIRRGERLYALAGEPVLLMYGGVPAYRPLVEGVSEGKDVEQLERNLAALGYEPGTVDQEFTDTTTAAVAAWQEDVGLETSGDVELGRVAFLSGPQRVTELEATLGEALGGGGGEEAAGESEPPSSPVLRTSSTRRVVSVKLDPDQQSIAKRGQKVQVVLPDGADVAGKVHALGVVEATGDEGEPGEETGAALEATIAVAGKHPIPALDGATVSVRFTQRVRKDVLSVPLTALVAIGGERFAVYVREDGARKAIVVTPGLAADGYVAIAGDGLRPGMTVETGE
jgi:peptidoglycan hydrolase-like protein with peptidoglycan-binding domain